MQVDIGEKELRQIVAGIAKHYTEADLVNKQVVVIANLKSAKVMGNVSNGMLLAAKDGETLFLVKPEKDVTPGSKVS